MKAFVVKAVDGRVYVRYLDEAESEQFDNNNQIFDAFREIKSLSHISIENPLVFASDTDDNPAKTIDGTIYLNPSNIVYVYVGEY